LEYITTRRFLSTSAPIALGTERDRAGGVSGKQVATKIPLPGHISERFALACDIFLAANSAQLADQLGILA
jgi:hypothetical protein